MPPKQLDAHGRLLNWASEIDEVTVEQALKTSRLPIVHGHVALMPDAHLGIGATVGSVIPTKDAIIPAAVGVDIGCGMIASKTTLRAEDLPDDLDPFVSRVARAVPAGVGRGHLKVSDEAAAWLRANPPASVLDDRQTRKVLEQYGTLGSGNHFLEVCLDEEENVWVVLHSGSRGIGNQLATGHIKKARGLAKMLELRLEDPDLAYFSEGTVEFADYIADMLWAQQYALANREAMMDNALKAFFAFAGQGLSRGRTNCHHNFTQMERHPSEDREARDDSGHELVWVTRKGAIRADKGRYGVIPGSMGTRSYIVRGRGNPLSWESCSHGAGRRMSRKKARKELSVDSFREAMEGKAWQSAQANELLDEHPASYKDIDRVMEDQSDLVEIVHTLRQVLNYKGT